MQCTREAPTPTEAALLDWAINLMADVVQQEHLNKMDARNIAMVFAPNMTQMADPLTALMYAVQVMNFLKTLIVKTLREREDSLVEPAPVSRLEPSDENGHQGTLQPVLQDTPKENDEMELAATFISEEPALESASESNEVYYLTDGETTSYSISSMEESYKDCETSSHIDTIINEIEARVITDLKAGVLENNLGAKMGPPSLSTLRKGHDIGQQPAFQVIGNVEKGKEISNLSCINSRIERIEAWR
ncbi:hypothetical protein NMG60_11033397 [Bertholletia excelsa]